MLLDKSLYKVTIFITLLAACTSTAQANFSFKELSPFVGVEVGQSNTKLQQKFGGPIFRKNATLYNIFGGLEFNEFWGMEVGYQRDNVRRKNNAELITGDNFPGYRTVKTGESPILYDTLMKFNHKYIGVTGQYKIFNNINISLLAGLSRASVNAHQTNTSLGGRINLPHEIVDYALLRTYKKSKTIPMLRAGINYKVLNNISLRTHITWIYTSRLQINSQQNGGLDVDGDPLVPNSIRLKNSIKYSIGIVAHI